MKIIVNIIAQNSEPELPALLASLKDRVDGVVAVDGGSQDKTVEIFEAWGQETGIPVLCKTSPWPDDFAKQRNLCLDITRATHGLGGEDVAVLMIDTDDVLAEFDRVFVEESFVKAGVSGLMCRMDNGNGFFHCLQFFKLNRDAMWKNPIHEYIAIDGPKGLPPVGKLTIKRGRSASHDGDPLRNVRIGRKFVENEPEDSRGRFYLARDIIECGVIPEQARRAEAEGHLRAYLSMTTNFVEQDRYARLMLVGLLCDGGRYGEAREILLKSIEKDPNNRSAYEAMSRLSDEKEAGVWMRLAAAAEGACILPYGSRLPKKIVLS